MSISSRRPGRASAGLVFLGSAAVLAGLVAVLAWKPGGAAREGTPPLEVFCAAVMKAPVEVLARAYQEAHGIPVQVQYGGSQTLITNAELSGRGDLYLPADDSYIDVARGKGLTGAVIPLAHMAPVVCVAAGNPKHVRSLSDLLRPDVRVAQANPDAAAIGKRTRERLRQTGQWDDLEAHTAVFKPTVNDVATDVKLGSVDVGVVWDATVRQMTGLEAVHVPELDGVTASVSVALLRTSKQPETALRFARFLASPDHGRPEFERQGFRPVDGGR